MVIWAKNPGVSWASGIPLLMIIKYYFTVILHDISLILDQAFLILFLVLDLVLFGFYEIAFPCNIYKWDIEHY